MAYFTVHMLLIVFAIILGISQSSDDCFYNPDHLGKKCFDLTHVKYTCCPLDHHCEQGKCTLIGATPPSNQLPLHNYILIGVGSLAVIGLICVIIVAAYSHGKQTTNTEKSFNRPTSFSQSSNVTFRSSSSAGFRTNNSALQPPSDEASVNIETLKTIKS